MQKEKKQSVTVSVTHQSRDLSQTSNLLCEKSHQWTVELASLRCKTLCNYKGKLLTLGKMMSNGLLMKTLPGADCEFMSSSQSSPLHPCGWRREPTRNMENSGWGGNALDFNKELSQQIAWLYINHAKALGNVPRGAACSSAPLWLWQESWLQNPHSWTVLSLNNKTTFVSVLTLPTYCTNHNPWPFRAAICNILIIHLVTVVS